MKRSQLKNYIQELSRLSKLSRLYSDEEKPFFQYRTVEKAFIRATKSTDVTRKDAAFDAIHPHGYGVGIKTFSAKSTDRFKSEKVAEFNKAKSSGVFKGLQGIALARKIAECRNDRIEQAYDPRVFPKGQRPTKKTPIYHLVVRTRGRFVIYEMPYEKIAIQEISLVPGSNSGLAFTDGKHHYNWNNTKSTLSMRFPLSDPGISHIAMTMSNEEIMNALMSLAPHPIDVARRPGEDYWVLPLFSPRSSKGLGDLVKPKSGINLRLASDSNRPRRPIEFELPIPAQLTREFPEFLQWTGRATPYSSFLLPNGAMIKGRRTGNFGKQLTFGKADQKIAADWLLKGISNSHEALWKKRTPFTYGDLEKAGFDSIRIDKTASGYQIRTAELGTYYRFLEETRLGFD